MTTQDRSIGAGGSAAPHRNGAGQELVDLAITAARRYYEQDRSKTEIARDLGLSRFQVARLLADARRDGLVRIEIGAPGRTDEAMSAELAEHLGVERAVVVTPDPAAPSSTVDLVGRTLAVELVRAVGEGMTVGLTWSRATSTLGRSVTGLVRCTVVQLAGAVYPPDGLPGSVEVARAVARVAGGRAHTIYSPLVVADAATAAGLRRQPEVAATLARAAHLDIAVLSVGAWKPHASAVHDLLDLDERRALADRGVVGEVSGHVIDADGHLVASTLEQRVVGASLSELVAVPIRLTSSHGAHRREATLAAVRAGLVHTLIVDTDLARALLS